MLGASLAMFLLVSAFVAFGSWPGASSGTHVNAVVLREVAAATPKKVAVRPDAVAVARRAALRRQHGAAARSHAVAKLPGRNQTALRSPSGTTAPTAGTRNAVPSAPAGSTPVAQVPQPAQTVANNVNTTTKNVTQNVQQGVQKVQTQVNQVVDQVIGGPQQNTDGNAVQNVTNTVTNAAGSLLGH